MCPAGRPVWAGVRCLQCLAITSATRSVALVAAAVPLWRRRPRCAWLGMGPVPRRFAGATQGAAGWRTAAEVFTVLDPVTRAGKSTAAWRSRPLPAQVGRLGRRRRSGRGRAPGHAAVGSDAQSAPPGRHSPAVISAIPLRGVRFSWSAVPLLRLRRVLPVWSDAGDRPASSVRRQALRSPSPGPPPRCPGRGRCGSASRCSRSPWSDP